MRRLLPRRTEHIYRRAEGAPDRQRLTAVCADVRAALRAVLGEAETARLLADGAALDRDRAAALAQSL